MRKVIVGLSVLVGILLLIAAGMYTMLPAHSLPTFFPGFAPLSKHHYTHAVATFGLALVVFAFAWFQSGKKKSAK